MGIDVGWGGGFDDYTNAKHSSLQRLFTFRYENDRVRVWGDFYECVYRGPLKDLQLQKEEVDEILRMSLQDLSDRIQSTPEDFMPDACHAMRLYLQRKGDMRVNRR